MQFSNMLRNGDGIVEKDRFMIEGDRAATWAERFALYSLLKLTLSDIMANPDYVKRFKIKCAETTIGRFPEYPLTPNASGGCHICRAKAQLGTAPF